MPQAIKSITCHNNVRSAGGGVKQHFNAADGYAIVLSDIRVFKLTNKHHPEWRKCIPMENVYEYEESEGAPEKTQAALSDDSRGKRA
jgi:hypothetical protein